MNELTKLNNRFLIASLITVLPFFLNAQESESEKKFSKTCELRATQWVCLDNRFGNIQINNWDKSEVKVSVTIIARAANDAATKEILDAINIEYREEDTISFATIIKSNENGANIRASENRAMKSGKKRIEIHYVVYMPAGNNIRVLNMLGNTFIPDREGTTDILQSFGELTVGNLSHAGKIEVKYADMHAGEIKDAKLKIGYSNVDVKGLSGHIEAEFDFCKQIDLTLSKTIKDLDIGFSFSKKISVNLPKAINANLEIKTKNCKIINNSKIALMPDTGDEKLIPVINKSYSGVIGSGGARIKIFSSLGDIILN